MSTVENSSSIYTLDRLTHELEPSFIGKVGTNVQYQPIDQHAPMLTDLPRISSTPPSTPGLESIQGKEAKEDEEDDILDGDMEDDNGNDNDMDNEYNDYGYNDYDDYLNSDYSEPDEDHFFKDFAEADRNGATNNNGGNENTNTAAARRPKSKRYSRRHRSQKAMSRFDLQSFARQLHANRLSVLQTRQSRMILTEEDEQELDKLLARKHSLDDGFPLPAPPLPPVPALPSVPIDLPQDISLPALPSTATEAAQTQQQDTSSQDKDNDTTTMVMDDTSIDLAGPIPHLSISFDSIKKNSILLQKLNDQHPSINRSENASLDDMAPLSPSLSDQSYLVSPRQVEPVSSSESSSSNSSTSEKNDTRDIKVTPTPLETSTSTFTVKKKPSWIANHLKQSPNKSKNQLLDDTVPSSSPAPKPRKSMSVDTLRDQARRNEPSSKMTPRFAKTTNTTTDSTSENELKPAPSTKSPADQNKKPKLRLFGSLRQASRSSRATGEGGGFRGLMRNLSTVGQRQQQQQQPQPEQHLEQLDQNVGSSTESNSGSNSNNTTSTMSQAAMAVIHHDASVKKEKLASKANKKEKSAAAATTTVPELSTKLEVEEMMDGVDVTTEQVTHTATSTTGGVRLLTNLLAKARSRRSQKKAPINKHITDHQQQESEDTDDTAPKERNKVIRRTIIYVQPDALDFMKDGHLPPIPAPKNRQLKKSIDEDLRFSQDTMMDDASATTVEYATATKLTRQTSRRKRIVEDPTGQQKQSSTTTTTKKPNTDHSTTTITTSSTNKKWHLESVSEFGIDKCVVDSDDNDDEDRHEGDDSNAQLEGLELREMSDGSVVWGIVKKQGNRRSFFASKAMDNNNISRRMTEEEQQPHEKDEEHHEQQQHDDIERSVLALMGLEPDSLDHFSAQQQPQSLSPVLRANSDGGPRKSKKIPPPIPKRSPRRMGQDNGLVDVNQRQQQQQQHLGDGDTDSRRLQRGLSVEEQLDEMMLSIKKSQI